VDRWAARKEIAVPKTETARATTRELRKYLLA